MPPVSSTTPGQKTLPTYHVRTMAGDLEASKKGQAPASTPIAIEPSPNPAFPARPENLKTAATENIKLSFPKIDLPAPKSPETKIQPNGNWPPALKPKNPFNNPISQPIMPPQPQTNSTFQTNQDMKQMGPPMDLPTERPAFRPSPSAPRPLTPPPAPLLRTAPPNQIRPPLPPLPPLPLPKTGPAPLPPLPIPTKPTASLPKSGSGSKKKLVFMAVLGALILTFVVGEIWWFFLREEPSVVTTQELLPPPQELQPLLPPEEMAVVEPKGSMASVNLLNYDRVETLGPTDLAASAGSIVADGELVKIKIIDELTAETIALTLSDAINILKIKVPVVVAQNIAEEMELFAFGGNAFDQNECTRAKNISPNCWGPRLGLAIKATDSASLATALRTWEKTMSTDLRALVLAKTGTAATPTFQTGTYGGTTIRYKNLPINTVTVEYAILGDTLIITTSKSAMLKAIDAFGATEEPILNENE